MPALARLPAEEEQNDDRRSERYPLKRVFAATPIFTSNKTARIIADISRLTRVACTCRDLTAHRNSVPAWCVKRVPTAQQAAFHAADGIEQNGYDFASSPMTFLRHTDLFSRHVGCARATDGGQWIWRCPKPMASRTARPQAGA